jgi:hypothetical protein
MNTQSHRKLQMSWKTNFTYNTVISSSARGPDAKPSENVYYTATTM